ncbi:MAG: hypothetical protein K2H64_03450 [Desulfovibrio sp.]|nr:hypothetical protein [Desulfovibrio sp.]
MGWEYPTETLWRAQELYCVDRMSYAAIAEALDVSATTLKAWGQRYGWAQKRADIAQAESEIRVNTIKGRQKALEQLLGASDPKEAASMAFAVSSLESLALKKQELAASGKLPAERPAQRRKIAGKAEAVAALKEAVERKLGAALSDPDKITSATVQDIKKCLEMVAELEASVLKDKDERKTNALSPENARLIQNILGTGQA